MKKIIFALVILLIILLGLIFLKPLNSKVVSVGKQIISPKIITQSSPSPTPKPVLILDENSNLKQELKKITPADFSLDYKSLKEQTNSF